MKLLQGYDYRIDKPIALTRKQWNDELRKVIIHGGRRRHEAGETYAHGRDSKLLFEVYDYLPEMK